MLKICPALLALSGCFWATTKSEGQAMRRDITSLQDRIGAKEKALDAQVERLEKVLDDATKLLKRNSADLGADVESLRTDVREAKGLVVSINQAINELRAGFDAHKKSTDDRLAQLEQRLAQLESGKPAPGSSPDEMWRLGSAALGAGRYNDAIDIFKRLYARYPSDARADDAVFGLGQAYSKLKDWEHAIGAYQELGNKFPDGPLTDDGYYHAAIAAQSLKQCREGRAYLNIIKTKFPRSNVIKEAKALDARLVKDARNKSKCAG